VKCFALFPLGVLVVRSNIVFLAPFLLMISRMSAMIVKAELDLFSICIRNNVNKRYLQCVLYLCF